MANEKIENVDNSPELPDTAPFVDEEIEDEKEDYWGKLVHLTCNGNRTKVLTEEMYRAGRLTTCELAISERDVEPPKYSLISKVHFKIVRTIQDEQCLVFLEDLSTNGTFVNDQKVGRNKKVILQNGAEISLAAPNMKMFCFLEKNSSSDSWLHRSLASQFFILKPLGAGNFGDVRLVYNQETNERYAMKKILKKRMSESKIMNEVNILKRLKHPCIVQLDGIFDTTDAVYIILEYISGGNLLNRILKLKRIPEFQTKVIFYQLLLGVDYLHKEGITHRDLKPENILIENCTNSTDVLVKITDFGLSKVESSKSELKTMCGTMKYIAPEILAHSHSSYDKKVDIWSSGVILFLCLSGQLPFNGEDNTSELAQQIISGKYEMPHISWQFISKQAINLVKKMLIVKPLKRISLSSIFEHPWINDDLMKDRVNHLISEKSVDDLEPILKKQKVCN